MTNTRSSTYRRLRRLRWAATFEGASLLALVGIAVPLKHLAGLPGAVAVMGPLHGALFLLYVWMVFDVLAAEDGSASDIARLLLAAVLPFGALWSTGLLKRRQAAAEARSVGMGQGVGP